MPWVKALLSGVFGLEKAANSGSLRFIVIDGSTVQEPGANQTTYRLHIAIDLVNLTFREAKVTTDKEGEHLEHYTLEKGDVVIVDRGYNQPKTLVPFVERGGHIVLRYNAHSMNVYERDESANPDEALNKIDWMEKLPTLNGQSSAIPVYLYDRGTGKRVEAYVHAIPLSEKEAEKARRNVRQRAKKKGNTASKKALYVSGWVLIISTVPIEQLDTQTIAALYRLRWQVELSIKRMKSLLNIDRLRAFKESALAELYLHGKLLYAAIVEKISNHQFAGAQTDMTQERTVTPWRPLHLIHQTLRAAIINRFPYHEQYAHDAVKSLSERSRKRKLQIVPSAVIALLSQTFSCNAKSPIANS